MSLPGCFDWRRDLDVFLDGSLNPIAETRFRDHAGDCSECSERLLAADPAALFLRLAGPAPLAGRFSGEDALQLARRVSATIAARRSDARFRSGRWRRASRLAAAAVLIVACAWFAGIPGSAKRLSEIPAQAAEPEGLAAVPVPDSPVSDSMFAQTLQGLEYGEERPVIEGLENPTARVYHLNDYGQNSSQKDLQVVWIVDENLDI